MIEHDKHIRRAQAKISCEALHALLGLPKDVRIIGVFTNPEDVLYGRFGLVVEGHNLPFKHTPGEVLPEVSLKYRDDRRPVFDGFVGA